MPLKILDAGAVTKVLALDDDPLSMILTIRFDEASAVVAYSTEPKLVAAFNPEKLTARPLAPMLATPVPKV